MYEYYASNVKPNILMVRTKYQQPVRIIIVVVHVSIYYLSKHILYSIDGESYHILSLRPTYVKIRIKSLQVVLTSKLTVVDFFLRYLVLHFTKNGFYFHQFKPKKNCAVTQHKLNTKLFLNKREKMEFLFPQSMFSLKF
jgi:hypothetical protein